MFPALGWEIASHWQSVTVEISPLDRCPVSSPVVPYRLPLASKIIVGKKDTQAMSGV
jgi:hypothetical protein